MHAFTFKSFDRLFKIVASSDQGPQMILYASDNILACQFHIHSHYPGSVRALENFVREKMRVLKSEGKSDLDIVEVDENLYDCGKNLQKNQ